MRESHIRFIRQLGFSDADATEQLYQALMLQPRVVGAIVVLGIGVQSPVLFLVLATALWWSALVPARNPFDALYNRVVAARRGLTPLGAAPAPRRFAAGLAGTVALTIGIALLAGAVITASVVEGLLAIAVAAVVLGDSCAGANLYHRLRRVVMARPSSPPDAVRH